VGRDAEAFARFVGDVEPRLRRAFVAAYGTERGRDATAEALGWAWEHWDRVERMQNPAGYLWRVGQTRSRPRRKEPVVLPEPSPDDALVEPALVPALQALTEHQRAAVLLVHGYGWQLKEVAELMDVKVTTVQNHLERAMTKLRAALAVETSTDA
jgi:RNA polymerase sigma-70 factor (ECF subfamily)